MEERRKRRTFDDDFKKKMVDLFNAGKPRAEIVREYELTASVLDRWITRINKTGSSKEADNRSDLENELLKLKKQNRQLQIENDILKQAALILGRR